MQAIEQSYDDMCPFPLASDSYRPDFRPERACTFNKTSETIYMSDSTFCPEGHRCACPVLEEEELDAVDQTTWENHRSLIGQLTHFLFSSQGTRVDILRFVALAGTLAVMGHWLTNWGWTITLGSVGVGLLVYGVNIGIQAATYTCQSRVDCYPMDCVQEEGIGCRINLESDGADQRNPYWFMPPPMYKCGVNRWGNCRLEACTASEARVQVVGEDTAQYGLIRRKNRSIVKNCQPMLAADMTHPQMLDFEDKVADLRTQEHQVQRRTHILAKQLDRFCPFLRPTDFVASATCTDGTQCEIDEVPGPNCCLYHGGVRQCPSKFPKLCADNFCDTAVNNCRNRGGLKECPAMSACPYILPTLQDDAVECYVGGVVNTSTWNDTEQWCKGLGGVKACPWNLPVMCESQTCNGEHCCSNDCSQLGGPRACEDLQIKPLQSAAIGLGGSSPLALLWPLLAVALSLVGLRPARASQ